MTQYTSGVQEYPMPGQSDGHVLNGPEFQNSTSYDEATQDEVDAQFARIVDASLSDNLNPEETGKLLKRIRESNERAAGFEAPISPEELYWLDNVALQLLADRTNAAGLSEPGTREKAGWVGDPLQSFETLGDSVLKAFGFGD